MQAPTMLLPTVEQSLIDKQAIAQAFSKAACTYDQHAAFQRDVGQRLMDKLPQDLTGLSVLDLGCGTGYFTAQLAQRGAKVTAFDLSDSMLEQCRKRCASLSLSVSYQQGDAEIPPFANNSFDIVFSNLAIQWCRDLTRLFKTVVNLLIPEGRFYFSSLLDGSLYELQQSWAQVDENQHVNQFHSCDEINFALAQASIKPYHVDSVKIQVWYASAFELMKDLKGIGATYVSGRASGLTKRRALLGVEQAYRQYCNSLGQFPATYQVCLGLIVK